MDDSLVTLIINESNTHNMTQANKIFHFKGKSLVNLFVGYEGLSHIARLFPHYKMGKTDSLS